MYLNLVQLAESFGVSEKVVHDWIRDEGLPHVPDRGRLLFDRARVAHWAAAHGLMARAGFLAPQQGALAQGLALAPMLQLGKIWRDVSPDEALAVLGRILALLPGLSPAVLTLLRQRLATPGGLNWAPVGAGFALPHFSTRVTLGREAGLVALLLLRAGLPLPVDPPDGIPVTRMWFFIPPSPRAHLDILARLSRFVASGPTRDLIERAAPDDELHQAFVEADQSQAAERRTPDPA
jgi:nitrogen PTS system EIIA component